METLGKKPRCGKHTRLFCHTICIRTCVPVSLYVCVICVHVFTPVRGQKPHCGKQTRHLATSLCDVLDKSFETLALQTACAKVIHGTPDVYRRYRHLCYSRLRFGTKTVMLPKSTENCDRIDPRNRSVVPLSGGRLRLKRYQLSIEYSSCDRSESSKTIQPRRLCQVTEMRTVNATVLAHSRRESLRSLTQLSSSCVLLDSDPEHRDMT
jgi:hypothetical protein